MSPTADITDPNINLGMGEITGLRGNLEVKILKRALTLRGLVHLIGGFMSVKKYILQIFYDPKKGEIIHLSEAFSDADEYKLVIDDEEHDIPKDMEDYLNTIDSTDIGVS